MESAEDLDELKRKFAAGEIAAEAYRQAKIAAYQAGRLSPSGRFLTPPSPAGAPRAARPAPRSASAASAIEAKRRKLGESLARRRESRLPHPFVIVRPRGRRHSDRLSAAPPPPAPAPAPIPPAQGLDPGDEIQRRVHAAGRRLHGPGA